MSRLGSWDVDAVHCVDALSLLKGLPDRSVDAVIADPPYGTTELDFDQQPIDWAAWWVEVKRVLARPSSPVVLFSQQPFTTDLICSNRAWYRYEIVYEKTMPTGFLNAKRQPMRCHENIEVFSAAGAEYRPVFETSTATVAQVRSHVGRYADHYGKYEMQAPYVDNGKRYPRSVWRFAQRTSSFENTKTLHPTEKPVLLMERLVLTFSDEGALIVDPFAGSGTTGVAAIKNGRRFIGSDISAEYVALANKRLAQPYTPYMFAAERSAPGEGFVGEEEA